MVDLGACSKLETASRPGWTSAASLLRCLLPSDCSAPLRTGRGLGLTWTCKLRDCSALLQGPASRCSNDSNSERTFASSCRRASNSSTALNSNLQVLYVPRGCTCSPVNWFTGAWKAWHGKNFTASGHVLKMLKKESLKGRLENLHSKRASGHVLKMLRKELRRKAKETSQQAGMC